MHERVVDALLTGDPVEAEQRVRSQLMANGDEWTTKLRWPEPAGSQHRNGDGRRDGLTVTAR